MIFSRSRVTALVALRVLMTTTEGLTMWPQLKASLSARIRATFRRGSRYKRYVLGISQPSIEFILS